MLQSGQNRTLAAMMRMRIEDNLNRRLFANCKGPFKWPNRSYRACTPRVLKLKIAKMGEFSNLALFGVALLSVVQQCPAMVIPELPDVNDVIYNADLFDPEIDQFMAELDADLLLATTSENFDGTGMSRPGTPGTPNSVILQHVPPQDQQPAKSAFGASVFNPPAQYLTLKPSLDSSQQQQQQHHSIPYPLPFPHSTRPTIPPKLLPSYHMPQQTVQQATYRQVQPEKKVQTVQKAPSVDPAETFAAVQQARQLHDQLLQSVKQQQHKSVQELAIAAAQSNNLQTLRQLYAIDPVSITKFKTDILAAAFSAGSNQVALFLLETITTGLWPFSVLQTGFTIAQMTKNEQMKAIIRRFVPKSDYSC